MSFEFDLCPLRINMSDLAKGLDSHPEKRDAEGVHFWTLISSILRTYISGRLAERGNQFEMISMKSKDFTPLVMWLTLLSGIIVLAFVRSRGIGSPWNEYPVSLDTVFIGLYVLWMLIELPISRRDVNTEGKRKSDCAICLVYGLGQTLTILSALWFPSVWGTPSLAHIFGISMFVVGVCYRLWAIRTLGQFYSHRVRTLTDHQIVDSGPYQVTRHPAYAGMLLANAGICLYFLNWVTTLIFLLILVPSILLRIIVEERMLFGIKGYSEFAEQRKRLFPAVW